MKVIRAERIENSGTYINFCMTCIETFVISVHHNEETHTF